MPIVTRTATVDLDSWFFNDGTNYGNGKGDNMAVGYTTSPALLTGVHRFGIRIPRGTLFDGIPSAAQITAFDIKLRARNTCVGIGGTVRFFLERGTTALAENSYADDCGLNTGGTVGQARYPGPTRDATNHAFYSGAPGNGDWITVNALALGQWWYAHPEVTGLVLVAVAANAGGTAEDEATTSRRCTFYSRETSSAPYASLSFNNESAPNAPSGMLPADGTKSPSTAGTSAAVSAVYSQPEGLAATHYRVQAFPAGTTDVQADTGAVLPTKDTGAVAASTASGATRSYTITGLAARTSYEWRISFARNGVWSTWSALLTITTAYQPGTPAQVSVTPNDLTPDIGASLASSDLADYVTAMEVNVLQDQVSGGTITKWASGKQAIGGAPTRGTLTYGGSALQYGQQYRLQVQLWNRDDIASGFTANVYFTELEAVGAVMTIGGVAISLAQLINSTTPTVRLSRPGGGNIDEARLQVWNEAKTTILWDSGLVGPFAAAAYRDIVVGVALASGSQPWFSGAIRNSGDASLGPYSDLVQGRINAVPGSPLLAVTDAAAVVRADGVVVIDAAQPTVLATNRDTDVDLGYADAVSRSEFEVRTLADAHFGASPYVDAAAPIATSLQLPALTAETTYKVRARYDDSAAQRSAFSDYLYVRRSASPTLTAVTPAAAATLTVPRARVAWTPNSTGGKAQAGYRLQFIRSGVSLYDTGYVASVVASGVATSHQLPGGTLPNGITVAEGTWVLTVYDTDGLSVTLTRTFATNFAAAPQPTGLTVTPDPDQNALVVDWDASTLTDDEFVAWYVTARAGAGQPRLVATITAKATSSYVYRAAHLNAEEIIQVQQDNGYAVSPPAEASALLEGEGTWRIGPDLTPQRLSFVQPGHTYPQAGEDAEYAPLGSDYKSVVTIGTWGVEGSFTLDTTDWAMIQTLRDDRRLGRVVLFKTWRGLSAYAKVREVTPTDAEAGRTRVAVRYTEVDPATAGF